MGYKVEILHSYRVTTQTKGENQKSGKFCPVCSDIGDGKCNVEIKWVNM
jgi:hypothetical protein